MSFSGWKKIVTRDAGSSGISGTTWDSEEFSLEDGFLWLWLQYTSGGETSLDSIQLQYKRPDDAASWQSLLPPRSFTPVNLLASTLGTSVNYMLSVAAAEQATAAWKSPTPIPGGQCRLRLGSTGAMDNDTGLQIWKKRLILPNDPE